jgi:CheY-like chemotaxis protein
MRPARGPKHPDAELYSAPMDHSYRAAQNNNGNMNGNGGGRPRPGFGGKQFMQVEPEPLPVNVDPNAAPKIFAFIEDLFFVAKINETARKLNLKVQFVKSEKEIFEAVEANGNEAPTLVIVDLNNGAIKPMQIITKLKAKFKKQTNVIGFLSHIQAELKSKAQEAGCDMVLPRSSFSANLPQLLRRHAAEEEDLEEAL